MALEKDDGLPRLVPSKHIVFLHPDLGIGGAERLVVDAAVGLQKRGHKVTIYTSHCDPSHCFDEARDGTLDVRVRGNSIIPSSIFSRFTIICAILRQIHLIFHIFFYAELDSIKPDAFFVDQLSAGLPLLRWLWPGTRVLFYCHFPDLLLAQGRQKWWKRLYRVPFDRLEEYSMSFADEVAVNSKFTRGMVEKTWPSFVKRKELKVVYPCVDVTGKQFVSSNGAEPTWKDKNIILSINRYEIKKDIGLAIKAYAGLPASSRKKYRLIIAGGYDARIAENYLCHKELERLASDLGLQSATCKNLASALAVPITINVLFLLSVPAALKNDLLRSARLLVYTPANEHFGIVPLEAMLVGLPVLAANTGGPLETVIDNETGWLRSPSDIPAWTAVMSDVLNDLPNQPHDAMAKISAAGHARVEAEFSDVKMAERIEKIVHGMMDKPRRAAPGLAGALVGLLFLQSAGFVGLAYLLSMRLG